MYWLESIVSHTKGKLVLNLKQIFLTKLNSILNPQFDKKIIWALMTFGFILIGYQNVLNLITSFEFKYKDFFLKLSLENESDVFLKTIGILFVLISSYFFYIIFIKNKDKIKFKTLKEASCLVKKILDDNKRIFKSYGPNSSLSRVDDIRTTEQLSLWNDAKENKIIPNNAKIYLVLENIDKFEENEVNHVYDMKSHIEAFKNHVLNKNTDYSKYQFPILFSILITKYCNNGLLKDKYFVKYLSWIIDFIDEYKINIKDKYLFGSTLYDKEPNDIDILIYIEESDNSIILQNSNLLNEMSKKFKSKFYKELQLTVFTKNEKIAYENFKNKLLDIKEF